MQISNRKIYGFLSEPLDFNINGIYGKLVLMGYRIYFFWSSPDGLEMDDMTNQFTKVEDYILIKD